MSEIEGQFSDHESQEFFEHKVELLSSYNLQLQQIRGQMRAKNEELKARAQELRAQLGDGNRD